jgi:hypothetical protein
MRAALFGGLVGLAAYAGYQELYKGGLQRGSGDAAGWLGSAAAGALAVWAVFA